MATEIELKAHVNDLDKILSIIRNTCGVNHECFQEKKDIYLTNHIDQPPCRVRLERKGLDKEHLIDTLLITVKDKQSTNGIEVNDEVEINSDGANFEKAVKIFKVLGYKEVLVKEKIGYSFIFDKFRFPLHLEVLEVPPMGWFLEMEFTPEVTLRDGEIEEIKGNLLIALKMFGINEDKIEKRFYRDMLDEIRGINYGIQSVSYIG
jgi:adenylate cyclase class 2